MNDVKLPVNYPITVTYPVDANAAMIISNRKEYAPWLFNSLIQLVSKNSDEPISYFDFHYRNCPLLYLQRINKNLINVQDFDNLKTFLTDAIDNGYYIYLIVNRKYIKAYRKGGNSRHDMLIYGYNREKDLLYIADAFKNGTYGFETCTFKELFDAVNNLSKADNDYMRFNNSIELLSLKDLWENEYAVLADRIKKSITDYLECKPTKYWYTQQLSWYHSTDRHLFGMDCYKLIYKELNNIIENRDITTTGWLSFNIMCEHKNIMLKRLKYMSDNGMLSDAQKVIDEYTTVAENALTCRNLIAKLMFSKDGTLVNLVFDKYKQLEEQERVITEKVLKNIVA